MPMEVGLTRHRGPEAPPEGGKCADSPVPAKERCPRCDSRDTKFCYYNNYNTSQPRHFCKSCRRYWTLGGSLRNVPIGGASRKRLRRSTPTSETPSRVVPRLSLPSTCPLVVELGNPETPAPPPSHGSVRGGQIQSGLLGLGETLHSDRTAYGLGLGLDLGYGSGPLPVTEEMGFGLAPSLLWPMDHGDTWRVGAGGGGCFAARPLVAGPAVRPLTAMVEGGAGPAAAGELQWWSCE